MSKKALSILVILALLVGAVSFVTAQDEDPIKIAAIFDLSGATGDVGTPYAEGVIAYVDWRNSNGGVNGRPIELISQDYAYSVETAENLYTQFLEEDPVVFLGWGTGDSEALRSRVAEDEIPFISASYSTALNDPQGDAPYNFILAPTYSDQLIILMAYWLEEWVAEGNDPAEMSVVVFHNDSPFGTSPLEDGSAFAEANGIGNFAGIPMPRGATDFTAELTQADDMAVTHIGVQNVSSPAALLATNASDFFGGMDFIEFGCLNWCADELFIELAGEAAEGAAGVIPFTPTTVEVEGQEAAREYLGGQEALEEATLHFTQGWAAIDVMVEAIARTLDAGEELTGPNVRAQLEQFDGYENGGLTAPVSFTAEDHRATRASNVYTVEGGIWLEASDGAIDLRDLELPGIPE